MVPNKLIQLHFSLIVCVMLFLSFSLFPSSTCTSLIDKFTTMIGAYITTYVNANYNNVQRSIKFILYVEIFIFVVNSLLSKWGLSLYISIYLFFLILLFTLSFSIVIMVINVLFFLSPNCLIFQQYIV